MWPTTQDLLSFVCDADTDLPCLQYGCLVVNAPTANTVAAAEHGIALICALSRNVAQADASVKRGEWKRSQYTGVSLVGKTLAIMGFGKVQCSDNVRPILSHLLSIVLAIPKQHNTSWLATYVASLTCSGHHILFCYKAADLHVHALVWDLHMPVHMLNVHLHIHSSGHK